MADKVNATCSICGKGYYKCLSCQSQLKATPWKQYTDTSEHYKIFQVVRGFNTGLYTKEQAMEKLRTIDLSDLNELRENIREKIEYIMKEEKDVCKVEEPVVEEPMVVEQVVVEQIAEESPVIETEIVRPSYVNRRKKYSERKTFKVEAEVQAE